MFERILRSLNPADANATVIFNVKNLDDSTSAFEVALVGFAQNCRASTSPWSSIPPCFVCAGNQRNDRPRHALDLLVRPQARLFQVAL